MLVPLSISVTIECEWTRVNILPFLFVFSGVQMVFAIDKVIIGENNDTINIAVNKVGDAVLPIDINLTRSYNTTGKSYNFALI